MNRRFEFDTPGGTASFRLYGRCKPNPALCQAMHWLACAAIAHMGIEASACDPRVGDRIIGLDSTTMAEVMIVFTTRTGLHRVMVKHTDTELPLGWLYAYSLADYQTLVTTAIQGGHTFHAVEDDEE